MGELEMNPTPVAWKYTSMRTGSGSFGTKYPDLIHPEDFVITELFSEAQLRQAKADALREAADECGKYAGNTTHQEVANKLRDMAAELEKS